MKISFQKSDVLDAVQRVQSVVTTKTTLSILSNLMMETGDGHVVLTGTDLQVGITCKSPCKVGEAGGSTMPARILSSILREIPSEDVQLSVDSKDIATITSERSFFKVMGITKEEYPKLPDFSDEEAFTIEQKVLGDRSPSSATQKSRGHR